MDLTSQWRDWPIAVFDLETTGFDNKQDRIIEVGVVRFEGRELVDSWGTLINEGRRIPEEVVKLTGIENSHLRGQPRFEEIAETVLEKLEGCIICAYNIDFDKGFLTAALERCGLQWPEGPLLDPLVFARQAFPKKRSKKLIKVSEYLSIPLEEAHRAVNDAEAAGRVWFALANKFGDQLPGDVATLLELQGQWKTVQDAKAFWKRDEQASLGQFSKVGLGASYLFGEELDPLRALYTNMPEIARGSVSVWDGKTNYPAKVSGQRGRRRGKVVRKSQAAR